MNDIDDNVTPERVPDIDPQSLDTQPSREEFFLLSRVDGSMTVGQLCKTSGLGTDKTIECLRKLHQYGLVNLGEDQPVVDSSDTTASPTEPQHSRDESSSASSDDGQSDNTDRAPADLGEVIRTRFPVAVDDFAFDQQLLEQSVELGDDFKREVLFVYEQLEDVNHYELLGVDSEAGRRDLRKAYFRMSKRYHPDRFYQKILGDYESMIEAIFQRVTSAYQTLTNERKREEYDQSLQQGQAHGNERQASTPASRRSEPREEMKGDQKKKMAFKVLVQRSDEALEQGNFTKAVDGYRKALSLQRDAELAMRIARRLLDEDRHLDDATSFARAAQKIDESSPDPLELLGRIYELKESPEDAVYHYQQALEAGADNPELRERIKHLES